MEQIFVMVFIVFVMVILIGLCLFAYIRFNSLGNQSATPILTLTLDSPLSQTSGQNVGRVTGENSSSAPITNLPSNQINTNILTNNNAASASTGSQIFTQMTPIPIQRPAQPNIANR